MVCHDERTFPSPFGRQTSRDGGRFSHGSIYTASYGSGIDYANLRAESNREVERFTNMGSGWTLTAILRCRVHTGEFRPLVGSSFVPTPADLVRKQALINVYNPND